MSVWSEKRMRNEEMNKSEIPWRLALNFHVLQWRHLYALAAASAEHRAPEQHGLRSLRLAKTHRSLAAALLPAQPPATGSDHQRARANRRRCRQKHTPETLRNEAARDAHVALSSAAEGKFARSMLVTSSCKQEERVFTRLATHRKLMCCGRRRYRDGGMDRRAGAATGRRFRGAIKLALLQCAASTGRHRGICHAGPASILTSTWQQTLGPVQSIDRASRGRRAGAHRPGGSIWACPGTSEKCG
jgi:hypothetical protein